MSSLPLLVVRFNVRVRTRKTISSATHEKTRAQQMPIRIPPDMEAFLCAQFRSFHDRWGKISKGNKWTPSPKDETPCATSQVGMEQQLEKSYTFQSKSCLLQRQLAYDYVLAGLLPKRPVPGSSAWIDLTSLSARQFESATLHGGGDFDA